MKYEMKRILGVLLAALAMSPVTHAIDGCLESYRGATGDEVWRRSNLPSVGDNFFTGALLGGVAGGAIAKSFAHESATRSATIGAVAGVAVLEGLRRSIGRSAHNRIDSYYRARRLIQSAEFIERSPTVPLEADNEIALTVAELKTKVPARSSEITPVSVARLVRRNDEIRNFCLDRHRPLSRQDMDALLVRQIRSGYTLDTRVPTVVDSASISFRSAAKSSSDSAVSPDTTLNKSQRLFNSPGI